MISPKRIKITKTGIKNSYLWPAKKTNWNCNIKVSSRQKENMTTHYVIRYLEPYPKTVFGVRWENSTNNSCWKVTEKKINIMQTPEGSSNLCWGFSKAEMTQSYHQNILLNIRHTNTVTEKQFHVQGNRKDCFHNVLY